jgi:hypothetical protein
MLHKHTIEDLPDMSTTLVEQPAAVNEIFKRRQDTSLKAGVLKYLENDIPDHFNNLDNPIVYLSRHIASPNFETLKFLDETKHLDLPVVIGEDITDKFVSINDVKKKLAKLSVEIGQDKNEEPMYQNHTVIDFNSENGKPLNQVSTLSGDKLVNLHKELFTLVNTRKVLIADESEWVTRHNQGPFIQYYEKFLALFIWHGVMYEFFAVEDVQFVNEILKPAFENTTSRFGVTPLIVPLLTADEEFERDWLGYPMEYLPIINKYKA